MTYYMASIIQLVIWLNIYENKTLDIATFNPSILNAEGKIEVEIKWNNIIRERGVSFCISIPHLNKFNSA